MFALVVLLHGRFGYKNVTNGELTKVALEVYTPKMILLSVGQSVIVRSTREPALPRLNGFRVVDN
jgi:hypothetical protein